MRVPDAFDRYDAEESEPDNEDGVQCRRCGTADLYWQRVTQSDGYSEEHRLFDSKTNRPHRCKLSTDAFDEVSE